MAKALPALAALTVGGLLAGWLIFVALARLIGSDLSWWHPRGGALAPGELFDVVRSAATIAALFGGLFAILYAYRKQRVEEAAGHRADADALSRRYQDAAEQLGHERAAVRLAGVYAMARLADDWPEQRQTCVDVLCAYLRMRPDTEDGFSSGEQEVRRTIASSMDQHLGQRTPVSWIPLSFDLRGAILEDLMWPDITTNGMVLFDRAVFRGSCEIGMEQLFLVSFDQAVIEGDLRVEASSTFMGGSLDLTRLSVKRGGTLRGVWRLPSRDRTLEVNIGDLMVHGEARLGLELPYDFRRSTDGTGTAVLSVDGVNVSSTGRLEISAPDDVDATRLPAVRVRGLTVETGGVVRVAAVVAEQSSEADVSPVADREQGGDIS